MKDAIKQFLPAFFSRNAGFFTERKIVLKKRIAIIGIIVELESGVEPLNALLHEYGGYIVGRMGLPMHDRGINIISVVICAENNIISTLSGKLGRINGVNAKVTYSNVEFD